MKRLLVRMPNWLGDIVMAMWALDEAARLNPGLTFDLVVRRQYDFLAGISPLIGKVFPTGSSGTLSAFTGGFRLRSRLTDKYDAVVLFPNSFTSALEMRLAGAGNIHGYARDCRSILLTRALPVPEWEQSRHIYFYYLNAVLSALGKELPAEAVLPRRRAKLKLRTLEEISVANPSIAVKIPSSFFTLSVGAAYGPAKQWSASAYARTASLIFKATGSPALVIGSSSDSRVAGEVCAAAPRAAYDVTGCTALDEAAGLFSESIGFVGNDSGLMHLAAWTGVPTVGIFLSTDDRRTAPIGIYTGTVKADVECRPCFKRKCPKNYECRNAIRPEEVAEEFISLLRES